MLVSQLIECLEGDSMEFSWHLVSEDQDGRDRVSTYRPFYLEVWKMGVQVSENGCHGGEYTWWGKFSKRGPLSVIESETLGPRDSVSIEGLYNEFPSWWSCWVERSVCLCLHSVNIPANRKLGRGVHSP